MANFHITAAAGGEAQTPKQQERLPEQGDEAGASAEAVVGIPPLHQLGIAKRREIPRFARNDSLCVGAAFVGANVARARAKARPTQRKSSGEPPHS